MADHLRQLAGDAGLTERDLAVAAGLGQASVCRILDGTQRPTIETYQRLATVLGADLAVRLYPATGPAIHDRWQAPMLEALLGSLHPRWEPYPEVAVRAPSRGWIDAALHDARATALVATEIQSELRRLEQLIRWHGAKADSLPSWDRWPRLGPEPRISRLLIGRRTRASRATAAEFGQQIRVAYPAHPDDALAALTTPHVAWPGAALVWGRRGRGQGAAPPGPVTRRLAPRQLARGSRRASSDGAAIDRSRAHRPASAVPLSARTNHDRTATP